MSWRCLESHFAPSKRSKVPVIAADAGEAIFRVYQVRPSTSCNHNQQYLHASPSLLAVCWIQATRPCPFSRWKCSVQAVSP
eukprot:5135259-Pleurochrysis_carterae.AAC.1